METATEASPDDASPADDADVYDIVLFYAYTSIENPEAVVATLKEFFAHRGGGFAGRVLVASEGVNGTVCGRRSSGDLPAFQALLSSAVPGCATMPYKKSLAQEQVFYDARVEKVRELVGWNARDDVPYRKSPKVVHLKPKEFHEALKARGADAKLLDLRNENESLIGKFCGATCPDARNMQELGRFLDEQASESEGKEVFMYCTGGIRCEKAALYLEKRQPGIDKVYQLEGGIHEYLEEFGERDECLYLGKNFTFDKRGVSASGKEDAEVWTCQRCREGAPTLGSCAVCVVCRFPLVLCTACQSDDAFRGEWTCSHHANLDGLYSYYSVPDLSTRELTRRISRMKEIEDALFAENPKTTTNRRRTIRKCYLRMETELERRGSGGEVEIRKKSYCRNSGRALAECPGDCMGFWGAGHLLDKPDAGVI